MSEEVYDEIVKKYTEITAEELESKLANGEKATVFIGKRVCPYCRLFVPKLDNVVQKHKLVIYYLNSIDTPTDPVLQKVREKLGVKTVPSIITVDGAGQFTNLGIDSSFSEEKVEALLGVA